MTYAGETMLAIATLHEFAGLWRIPQIAAPFRQCVSEGWVNTVGRGAGDRDKALSVWFHVGGLLFFFAGLLMRDYEKETQRRLPKRYGYLLLAGGGAIAAAMPKSGFWLIAGLGGYLAVVGE